MSRIQRPAPDNISPIRANGKADDQKPRKKNNKKKKNSKENILCAIIALMKELDKSGLEFVKMDAKKRIAKIDQKQARKDAQNSDDESDDSDY